MAELAVKTFVGKDDLVNVTGIVLAGLADLKHELNSPKILDKRVREKILRVVDVQYGMRKGLDEAILQVADLMREVKLVKDQKLLQRFMMELADDDGLCSCGVGQTMFALEDRRAVTTLICWENLAVRRYTLRDDLSGDTRVVHWTPPRKKGAASDLYTEPGIEELLKSARLDASDSGTDVAHYRVVDQVSLIEWLADHYREHEAKLVFVSDASEAGHQFVESFGGLAGLLRFKVDFEEALGAADGTDDDDPDDGFDDFDDFIVDEPPAAADDATAVEAPEEVKPGAVPVVLKDVGKESDEPKGAQPAPTLEVPPVLKVETPKVHPPTESFSPKPPTPASGNVGSKRAVAPPGFETVLPTPPHARGDDGPEVRAHSPPKEMSKLRYTGSVFVPRAKRGAPAVPDATTALSNAAHLAN